jgi:hypothetical protein
MVHERTLPQGLAAIVERTPSPLDVYDDAVPHYGGMILSKNNDPPEIKPQRLMLTYCRLYREDTFQLALRVLERIYQLTATGQATVIEDIKDFSTAKPYIYISWAEFITATPQLADDAGALKAQHVDIEQIGRKEQIHGNPVN